ncbi:APC family permease [Larkinella humicola]|uniref:Amino acid permease n=1 Tax=Larkinella humicola TaxID=2607654 RepID=A0A5N1J7A2_9BACT|nr:amino acid permease [Larkinella humicola]KAA9346668.1 amino acid permease [Larkinella humicola]
MKPAPKLARVLSLPTAIVLVISVMVGSGVFKKIAPMADALQSPGLILLCWLLAGLVSLAGALTNAEMAGMFPNSGGEYIYYQKVYNRFFAFIYGWSNFTVVKTAAISALAHIFAQSLVGLLVLNDEAGFWTKGIASALIILLSLASYRGIRFAGGISWVLMCVILLTIVGITIAGFSSPLGSFDHLSRNSPAFDGGAIEGMVLVKALFIASLGAFWGYDGWNNIAFLGEEIRNPQRNLPLALGIGTLFVVGLYLLLNVMYVYVLPIEELIALNQTPGRIAAVEVIRRVSGSTGATLVSVLILCTTFNATNSSILTSARLYYAMARDGLFFSTVARIHPRFQSPSVSIVWQAVWAVALVWSGTFDQLTDMLVFASFIFYGSTAFGVLLLRRSQPDLSRPYRVIGYPVLPVVFCLFCMTLVVITLIEQPREALMGLGLIATGIPFYGFWYRQKPGKV